MKKILFVTSTDRACTGMLADENYEPLLFVAFNKLEGSDQYAIFTDGKGVSNGRNFTDANSALEDAKEMYGADMVLPVPDKQLREWFGDDYKLKRKEYKEELTQAKREERERKKLAEESKKSRPNQLWLKNKASGMWN
jgi:intein/homing endonuclease